MIGWLSNLTTLPPDAPRAIGTVLVGGLLALIALIWTPLGIAALVAADATVAALIYLPRAAVPLALVAGLLAGVAYVSHLQADLASSRAEATAAKADAAAKGQAIAALESDAAESAKRAKTVSAAHARIRQAPALDDGPVAPVLRDALKGLRR